MSALPFASSTEHLLAEIDRVDRRIRLGVHRARQVAGDDAFRGLSVSDADLDAIFARPLGAPHWIDAAADPAHEAAFADEATRLEARRIESERAGVPLRLAAIASVFGLDRFDLDLLLIALAPEIDLRYERLFAYLNDDVTRKRPTIDVALGLLCASFEQRLAARAHFAVSAPLLRHNLVRLVGEHNSRLGAAIEIDARIVEHLHGSDELDARLAPHAAAITPSTKLDDLLLPPPLASRVRRLIDRGSSLGIVAIEGPYGAGKRSLAEAVARALNVPLLIVRGASLEPLAEDAIDSITRLAVREARLLGAAIDWENVDRLLTTDRAPRPSLLRALDDFKGPTFIAGEAAWEPRDDLRGRPFERIALGLPSLPDQARLWARALGASVDADVDLEALAGRYRLTAGQIHDAAESAKNLAVAADHTTITATDLSQACRLHASRALSGLAQKVEANRGWDDLVLTGDRAARLREICDQARYRGTVLEAWGFRSKLPSGKGLSLLFTGPPGTGKTLAASVMAHELGLDLYRIDLSTVVSKYIGETEKQLAKLFDEAERSHSVLFFDEADALFGKRSEVKDAHDRYANIEVSYLLQRMESYEGVVILATNFSKNMDEAFVRRLGFILDFALPAEPERLAIWQRIWPASLPRDPALDLAFMARRFELAGGHIRNIALAAAYLAAAEGAPVAQRHLIHAARREYQKMGKVVEERMFTYPAKEG